MVIKYTISTIILLLFSFYIFRVIVRKDYLKNFKLSPISYILECIVFALHANFMYLFLPVKWPNLPPLLENQMINTITLIILTIGLLILIIAWFGLGTSRSFGQDKNKLKTEGIYKYSRNPQIIGYGLLVLSFTILYLSWFSIGWFILYLMISYFMISSEEEFLKKKYVNEYLCYCKSVPRIIGNIKNLR